MSLTRTYVVPGADVAQLHDELLRAGLVPEVVQFGVVTVPDPAPPPPPALPTDTYADTVTLVLPDGTVEAEVDAVVAAHVPQARYDPATRLREVDALRRESGRAALRVRTATAATVAELRAVLLEHLKAEEEAEA